MTPDLLTLLGEQAEARPDALALGALGAAPLSFADLMSAVRTVRDNLRANGFRSGDRMLFSIRPCPEAVVLVLGVVAAGGTIVFVDPGVGPELFARRLELVEPAWAATESLLYLLSGPLRAVGRARGLELPRFGRLPVRHIHSGPRLPGTPADSIPLQRLSRPAGVRAFCGSAGELPAADIGTPDDEALIVFTSGTTAEPKAVVHSRGSLSAGLAAAAGRTTLGPDAHLGTEQLMMGLPALVAGARWSMPRYPRLRTHIDPLRFAAELDGLTHAFFTPSDLAAVLDAVEAGTLAAPRGVREISLGGAPVTVGLLERCRKLLPHTDCLAIYGMTEVLPVAVISGSAKLAFRGDGDPLGPPADGVVARIAADGELLLSGPALCRGYLGEPPLTEVGTGDLARFDGDLLVLTGRKKDMMIRGKTNIYPGLYEPAITALDGVRDAVLVGIPDGMGDELIVLAVVAEPGAVDLVARVRRELPARMDHSALPDKIVVVERIPVTGRTRKPDRAALRRELAAVIGG
ncbi:class I adenylate-forming enzyme family protein [Nocardia stercoris]|uniref:Long-chain fatty acid--CoA ligase n=1 Tax=Nocardia stercoris TaxID=2483361 RepID=A0A3M2LH80_9NOCA|nr:class I adenylate-forming enzyme family protein [Nocardia stercoris]RMI35345.1 long-chain fatty acid--CoA ligase [Nocardia stercoris]